MTCRQDTTAERFLVVCACFLALALTLTLTPRAAAEAPPHHWSEAFGSTGEDMAWDAVADPSGNVIYVGEFCGQISFGGDRMVSAGGKDLFVAKFDPDGNHLWSETFGDFGLDRATAVASDATGNIYVTGGFEGAIDFGGGELVSVGREDIFLAVFEPNGGHIWSDSWGGEDAEHGSDLEPNPLGDIYLIGSFTSKIDFGSEVLVSEGASDIFLAKFRATGGELLWTQRFGDEHDDHGSDVAVASDGGPVLSGTFEGKVSFGGSNHLDAGDGDIYLARLDPNGGYLWSQSFSGNGEDYAGDVTVDLAGNILLLGGFSATVDFGGGALVSNGDQDVVLAKYRPDGSHLFSRSFGDAGQDVGVCVVTDRDENIVILGDYRHKIDFGGEVLSPYGESDVFVAKFKSDGAHLWSHSWGGVRDDHGTGIAVAPLGQTTHVGYFYKKFNVDTWYLASTYGSVDMFLINLDEDGIRQWMTRRGSTGLELARSVATGEAGSILIAGLYEGHADFGGDPLPYEGDTDFFVAKYTAAGGHDWSAGFGTFEDDSVYDLVVDGQGNVYVTGYYEDEIDFGGGPLQIEGHSDMFLVKFDAVGSHVWSLRIGPNGQQGGYDLALDPSGDVVVVGSYTESIVVGDYIDSSNGSWDVFIAKFDGETGAPLWCQSFGGVGVDFPIDVKVCGDGSVRVIGEFEDTIDCGGGSLTSNGFQDLFLASFATDGTHLWSANYGSSNNDDYVGGIAVDDDGNVYAVGRFVGVVDLGGGDLYSSLGGTIFLAQYDAAGTHVWSVNTGGIRSYVTHMVRDLEGRLILTGSFIETADFGDGDVTADEDGDAYLAAYDGESGAPVWSEVFEGPGRDRGYALAIDHIGNLLLTGFFYDEVDLGGTLLSSSGAADVFLARYGLSPSGIELLDVLLGSERPVAQPNPFVSGTTITLGSPVGLATRVTVHDVAGRVLRTLERVEVPPGSRSVSWDGRDGTGRGVAPGVYFVRIEDENSENTVKLVRVR